MSLTGGYTGATAARLLSIMSQNAFVCEDEYLLFTHAARINHSCVPNAVWIIVGRHQVIYTVRELAEGEQVFISYRYGQPECLGFECACPLCRVDSIELPVPAELRHMGSTPAQVMKTYETLRETLLYEANKVEVSTWFQPNAKH